MDDNYSLNHTKWKCKYHTVALKAARERPIPQPL